MANSLSILIIESNPESISFLITSLNKLQSQGIHPEIKISFNLKEAMQILSSQTFDILLMDLYLQDSQGIETFIEVQKKTNATPIIIVGSSKEDEVTEEAIKLGAQDYLPLFDLNGALLSRIIHHAIERHRLHESLKALSFTDELTKVYNRRGLFTLLEQQIALAKRMKNGFYLFIIDLDHLKHINDTYGHLIGDHALIEAAKCLRSSLRQHDIIGRIGGDEFAAIALNIGRDRGHFLKQHMLEKLTEYNAHLKEPYHLSFSVGMAYFDGKQSTSVDALLQEADHDLYKEKRLSHEKL